MPQDPSDTTEEIAQQAAAVVPEGPESLLRFADALAFFGDSKAPAPAEQLQLVTFYLDREEYAVPIGRVREIVRVGSITRVPESPPHIRGVTNLRGRILPVVEIRSRLGLQPGDVTMRSRILLLEAHGRTLGVLVDSVAQIVKLPVSAIAPAPEEALSAAADYVRGVAQWQGRLLILLDVDKALLLRPQPEEGQVT